MGRQKKLTETFTESKILQPALGSTSKLPVKRKLVSNGDENFAKDDVPAAAAVQVGLEDTFMLAKKALHTSRPLRLPGRETQIKEIYGWLHQHLTNKESGAMYVSGAPGVGKTAVIQHSIYNFENLVTEQDAKAAKKQTFYKLFINCMSIQSPVKIYEEIGKTLKLTSKSKGDTIKEKLSLKILSKTKTANMMVLILDEMDQLLDGKGNEILYSLFEWARVPGSKLILIGIANALDLTVRHLPLLEASSNVMINSPTARSRATKTKGKKSESSDVDSKTVKVVNFPPYERSDIESILEARLIEIGSQIFDPMAIKFVAAKVAASTGDMRKALNSCKQALDAVEKQQRSVLRSTTDDGFNFSSPKKCCMFQEKVGVATLAKVFGPQKDDGPLPLQQMIVLGTLLRIYKEAPHSRQPKIDGVTSPVPVTTLYDEYRKICTEKGFSWIDRSEIVSVCSMLQDRSLVSVIENMSGGGASKKFGSMTSKNKTGFMFDPKAVEKIVMLSD